MYLLLCGIEWRKKSRKSLLFGVHAGRILCLMMVLWTSQVSCLSLLPITRKRQLPMKILHFWLCFHQPLCNHVLGYMYPIVQSLIILQFLLHLWPGYSVRYSDSSLSIFRRAPLPVHFMNFASCTSILQSSASHEDYSMRKGTPSPHVIICWQHCPYSWCKICAFQRTIWSNIIGMLRVVSRGNKLEIKLGFQSNLHSNHLQMTKCCTHSKEGQYTYSN